MIRANYPAFATHKAEHDKFRSKVQAFQKDYQAGVASVSIETMDFLSLWLINHINENRPSILHGAYRQTLIYCLSATPKAKAGHLPTGPF